MFLKCIFQQPARQKAGSIKPNDIVDWSVTTEVVRELDKEKK
jgi:hypothetical protein